MLEWWSGALGRFVGEDGWRERFEVLVHSRSGAVTEPLHPVYKNRVAPDKIG